MITYKFCITKFNLTVKQQGTQWVVRDISWIYSGRSVEGVYASIEGTTPIPFDLDQPIFLAVEDVTADILTLWLLEQLGGSFLRHLKESIEGTIERNARILNGQTEMQTWLPLPSPSNIEVSQEVMNAYLSR